MLNLATIHTDGIKLGAIKTRHAQACDNVAFVTTLIMRGVKSDDLPRLEQAVKSKAKWRRLYDKSKPVEERVIIADGRLHEKTFAALKALRAGLRIIAGASECVVRGVAGKQEILDKRRRQAMAAQSWWHGLSPQEQALGNEALKTFIDNPEKAMKEADDVRFVLIASVARAGIWWKQLHKMDSLLFHEGMRAVREAAKGNPGIALNRASMTDYIRYSDLALQAVQRETDRRLEVKRRTREATATKEAAAAEEAATPKSAVA
jgi:hypothetical protein